MGWGGVWRCCAQVRLLLCRTVVSAWEQEVLGIKVLISRCRCFCSGAPLPATRCWGETGKTNQASQDAQLELSLHAEGVGFLRCGNSPLDVRVFGVYSAWDGHSDMGMAAATGRISTASPLPD